LELNGPNVAGLVPLVPQLIPLGTGRVIAGIDRLAGIQQGEMAIPWGAVIGECA
jgi:hypothetical protein